MQRYFYYCTDKVMEAVNIGTMEMFALKQIELSPEFILMGLLQQEDSMLSDIFEDMGEDSKDIQGKILDNVWPTLHELLLKLRQTN